MVRSEGPSCELGVAHTQQGEAKGSADGVGEVVLDARECVHVAPPAVSPSAIDDLLNSRRRQTTALELRQHHPAISVNASVSRVSRHSKTLPATAVGSWSSGRIMRIHSRSAAASAASRAALRTMSSADWGPPRLTIIAGSHRMRTKTSTSSARTLRSLMPGIMTVGLGYRPIHARSPHLGTVAGAVLALGIDLLLPGWALVATLAMLMVATVAYAFLGDYARQVMVMTPMIVLLGAGSSSGRAEVAAERVLATLLGAVIAAGIALALARYEREYPATQPWASPGGSGSGSDWLITGPTVSGSSVPPRAGYGFRFPPIARRSSASRPWVERPALSDPVHRQLATGLCEGIAPGADSDVGSAEWTAFRCRPDRWPGNARQRSSGSRPPTPTVSSPTTRWSSDSTVC